MKRDNKTRLIKKLRYIKRETLRVLQLQYSVIAVWLKVEKPDFIGIGAPRSASTWLHKRLSLHPQVFLAKMKEVHYFDEYRPSNYIEKSGISWYRSFYFDLNKPSHWRWYYLQFKRGNNLVKGEITPDYSTLSPARVKAIADHIPDLKIIYIIRNPVDRAWSNLRRIYWHQLGIKSLSDIPEQLLLKSAMHPEVLIRGEYKRAIETWESCFDKNQILYLFFDDIIKEPRQQLEMISNFLQIDTRLLPNFESDKNKVNKAPESDMPQSIRKALSAYYQETIGYLANRFETRDFSNW